MLQWLSCHLFFIFRASGLTLPFTFSPVSCCIVAAVGEASAFGSRLKGRGGFWHAGRRRSHWSLPDEPISRGARLRISSEVVNNFAIFTAPALIGVGGERGGSPPWEPVHRAVPGSEGKGSLGRI